MRDLIRYSIWQDKFSGDYEIVRWKNRIAEPVQTNIKTWVKALHARQEWQKREEENRAWGQQQ